jgi:hypothetical protein
VNGELFALQLAFLGLTLLHNIKTHLTAHTELGRTISEGLMVCKIIHGFMKFAERVFETFKYQSIFF